MNNPTLPLTVSKYCNGCQFTLPATTEFFYLNSTRPSGLSSQCKKCRNSKAAKRLQGIPIPPPQSVTRRCEECDAAFTVFIHSRQRFCGKECSRKSVLERVRSLVKNCLECGVSFEVPGTCRIRQRRKFCSRNCARNARRHTGLSGQVFDLLQEGLTAAAIAEQLCVPFKRVAYIEHRIKYRRGEGLSESAIKYRWKKGKSCLICGFDRYIEAAHIIPARKGGSTDEANLMPLCPTHHRLFDSRSLLLEEAEKISDKVLNYQDFVAK